MANARRLLETQIPGEQAHRRGPYRDMFTELSKPLPAQYSGSCVKTHRRNGLKAEYGPGIVDRFNAHVGSQRGGGHGRPW